jgi:hypothetical protein
MSHFLDNRTGSILQSVSTLLKLNNHLAPRVVVLERRLVGLGPGYGLEYERRNAAQFE